MSLDVSALANFVKDDTRAPLFKMQFGFGKLQSECQKLTGIKSGDRLPLGDGEIYFQAGGGCQAINPSGTTVITQREFTMSKVLIEDGWCVADLEPKFTQAWLKEGSNYTESDLPKWITDWVLIKSQARLAVRDWFAVSTNVGDRYNGIGTRIDASGSFIAATATADVTVSNIIGIVDNMWSLFPAEDKWGGTEKIRLFMGDENFDLAVRAYRDDDSFNYAPDLKAALDNGEFLAPGTRIWITRDPGLSTTHNGRDKMYAAQMSNIYLAVDGTGDEEFLDVWYEKKDDKVYARGKFKRDWQALYYTKIVRYCNF